MFLCEGCERGLGLPNEETSAAKVESRRAKYDQTYDRLVLACYTQRSGNLFYLLLLYLIELIRHGFLIFVPTKGVVERTLPKLYIHCRFLIFFIRLQFDANRFDGKQI